MKCKECVTHDCKGISTLSRGGSGHISVDVPNSTASSIMYAPLGLQEMVLAVWLILKGFNSPAVTSLPASGDMR